MPVTSMRIGLAIFEGRVSPVLDVSRRLLIVDAEGKTEVGRHDLHLEDTSLAARTTCICGTGVNVLICGAVSWPLEAALVSRGIRVIPQVCGPVDEVLGAFLAGRLTGAAYLMPGCCGRRRHRGGRGGRRGRFGARAREA